MDIPTKIGFLKSATARLRTTQRVQTVLAAVLMTLGVTVVVLGLLSPGLILAESLRGGQTLGGAIVAASGFVPIRSSRSTAVQALTLLAGQYERAQQANDADEVKLLDQYFNQYYGKVLGS